MSCVALFRAGRIGLERPVFGRIDLLELGEFSGGGALFGAGQRVGFLLVVLGGLGGAGGLLSLEFRLEENGLDFGALLLELDGVDVGVELERVLLSDLASDSLALGVLLLLQQNVVELADDPEPLLEVLRDVEPVLLRDAQLRVVVAEALHRHADLLHDLFGVLVVLEVLLVLDRVAQTDERDRVLDAPLLRSLLHQLAQLVNLLVDLLVLLLNGWLRLVREQPRRRRLALALRLQLRVLLLHEKLARRH